MKNCPNCGAPLEPYRCKCEYCGTWYYDFTSFNMDNDSLYYIKFRTPHGDITTLAKPELNSVEITSDSYEAIDHFGNMVESVIKSRTCDFNIIFHAYECKENNSLYQLNVK